MMHSSPARRALLTLGATAAVAPLLAFLLASAKAAIWGVTRVPPHAVCWRAEPSLIWLHLAADILVWGAYTAVPAAVVYLIALRRSALPRLAFPGLMWAGALFVLLCGIGHLMDAAETWYSIQWVRGWVKVATAIASWAFVVLFFRRRRALAAFIEALADVDQQERDHVISSMFVDGAPPGALSLSEEGGRLSLLDDGRPSFPDGEDFKG